MLIFYLKKMNFTNSTKYSYVDGSNAVPILFLMVFSCICCLCFIIRCCYDYTIRICYDNDYDYCCDCCYYKSNKIVNEQQEV